MCTVTVAVGVDAELDKLSVDDVNQAEDVIISQWGEVSADEKHKMRNRVDEILRPLGYETSLLVIRRANSIAMLLTCLTLSAVMGLRDRWRSRQLRDIIEELFRFLSHLAVRVKRVTWPVTDYEQCLGFFSSLPG